MNDLKQIFVKVKLDQPEPEAGQTLLHFFTGFKYFCSKFVKFFFTSAQLYILLAKVT